MHTAARFTFGQPELYQGISFIPALIGLFGLSEVLRTVRTLGDPGHPARLGRQFGMASGSVRGLTRSLRAVFGSSLDLFWRRPVALPCRPVRLAR